MTRHFNDLIQTKNICYNEGNNWMHKNIIARNKNYSTNIPFPTK